MTGWPWPLDAVQSWFEDLWNWISEAAFQAADWLWDWIQDRIDWLERQVQSGLNWLLSEITSWFTWVKDRIWEGVTWVRDRIGECIESVRENLSSGINWLWNQVQGSFDWLKDQVSSGINWLWNQVSSGFNWLRDQVTSGVQWLWNQVQRGIEGAKSAVLTCVNTATQAVVKAFDTAYETLVKNLVNPLMEQLSKIPSAIGEGVKHFIFDVVVPALSDMAQKIRDAFKWVWDQARESVRNFINFIVSKLKEIAPATPEKVWEKLPTILVEIAGIGFTATLLASLPSVKVAGTGLDMRPVADFIRDVFNVRDIIAFTCGAIVSAGIKTPIEYYVNAMIRPKVLDFGYAMTAYSRGFIGDEEFKRYMAYAGYPDEYFPIFQKLADDPISPFLLYWVLETEHFSDEDIIRLCIDKGYSREKANLLLKIMKARIAHRYLRDLAMTAERLFVEGLMTEEQLRANLKAAGYRDEIIDIIVAGAKWRREKEMKEDLIKAYSKLYERRIINTEEFRTALEKLGVVPEMIDVIIKYEDAKTKGEYLVIDPLDYAKKLVRDVMKHYKYGYITREVAIENLKSLGLSDKEINFILTLAEWEFRKELLDEKVKAIREAYEKDIISDEEYIEAMKEIGIREDIAEALLELDRFRKLPKPKGSYVR